jgi:cytochrome d ubiquinol oxidase subunit I
MSDFWSILLSPVALNKFTHTVLSGWVMGGLFVIGVSSWFLLKKREVDFALRSIKVGSLFGIIAALLLAFTGDGSAYNVAQRQPMKLAAMEGLYEGQHGAGLIGFGVLNPTKKAYNDTINAYLFKVEFPKMLSLLAYRDADAFVPGVKDILDGGYVTANGDTALSFAEKKARGKAAIQSLANYQKSVAAKNTAAMSLHKSQLKANYAHFGYGYLDNAKQLIPHVPTVFYSFHLMVLLGLYFIALFALVYFQSTNNKIEKQRWLLWVSVVSIPLGYVAGELGWTVAEVGRQPWAIQDVLPVQAAISSISTGSVKITFFLFAFLFTALLVAEIRIMVKQIKKGPEVD